jgi:hypothetical protein
LNSKFNPPKFIKVGGRSIKVKKTENLAVEGVGKANGCYNHDNRLIELDTEDGMDVATLLHEATHAVLTTSGLADILGAATEEAVCRAMEMLAPSIYFRAGKK